MGQVITGLAAEDQEIRIVAGVDAFDQEQVTYPVFSSLEECTVEADVVIDFSAAPAVDELLAACIQKKLPCVLCTTGLSGEQLQRVQEASEQIAVLKSANMSLGINMLLQLLKEAAGLLAPAGFDIEIVEKHHNQKIDAPSGTAIALADSMNEELSGEYDYIFDRSKREQERNRNQRRPGRNDCRRPRRDLCGARRGNNVFTPCVFQSGFWQRRAAGCQISGRKAGRHV